MHIIIYNHSHRHGLGQFRENPLNFMIRLTAESSAFFSGSGWRAYENYIGSRILYPEYTDEVKRSVFESARVQRAIRAEAISQVSTAIHQKQRNTVGSDDDGFKARYERELQKHIDKGALKAKKYMDGLIADMSSKGLVRTVAFIVRLHIIIKLMNIVTTGE